MELKSLSSGDLVLMKEELCDEITSLWVTDRRYDRHRYDIHDRLIERIRAIDTELQTRVA